MKEYDIAVIGGGPAGMMAAIAASQNSSSVVLLEKNPSSVPGSQAPADRWRKMQYHQQQANKTAVEFF